MDLGDFAVHCEPIRLDKLVHVVVHGDTKFTTKKSDKFKGSLNFKINKLEERWIKENDMHFQINK